MALTNKLSAIGNAIREKTGKTELMTLDAMPAAIAGIETGGGGSIEVEPIVLTGDCSSACRGAIAANYIGLFGDTITTSNITTANYMFQKYAGATIPFEINFQNYSNSSWNYHECHNLFSDAINLTELPVMNNFKPSLTDSMFANCNRLRTIPENFDANWDWSYIDDNTDEWSASRSMSFYRCYSLRSIPTSFLAHCNPYCTPGYSLYYYSFYSCYALDELVLPVFNTQVDWYYDSGFGNAFDDCHRLKRMVFMGTENKPRWCGQTIDLSRSVGWGSPTRICGYNSGITADKEVKDAATYEALKNDPDWFSYDPRYARYNHDSAVETINSLPDTSAFCAEMGDTNTIKFDSRNGSLTDGGAIGSLTDAEIAVAAAKGWTVTLV